MAKSRGGAGARGNAGSEILACTCQHEDQDARYGRGRRVKNKCNGGHRCTVCLREP